MFIIGHRGARNEAPENTLLGFKHLRSLGINRVELDVRLSQDNKLMVLHDATIDRTTNSKGKVNQLSAAQLATADTLAAFRPQSRYATTLSHPFNGVPTLDQVISEWPNLESIQLEVKTTDKQSLEGIAQRLNFLIEAHQIHQQACITSSDISLLRIVAQHYRHLTRGYVAERFRRDPVQVCVNLGCDFLVINWRICTEELIEKAHAHGLHVSAWTVNKVDVALRLCDWGADSIITDVPTAMLKVFNAYHYHHVDTFI